MWTPETNIKDNLTLWITHECNMNCVFCRDSNHKTIKGFMSLTDVEHNLKIAKDSGIKTVLIGGGEPTLHPNIIEIAKLCKQFNFFTVITTNYTKPEIIKQLDGIIDTINISLYEENKESIPNQSDFQSTLCLKVLIYSGRWKNKKEFDEFIDFYKQKIPNIVFGCMRGHTTWCKEHNKVEWLSEIEKESTITQTSRGNPAYTYRGCYIDRKDLADRHERHMMVDTRGFIFDKNGETVLSKRALC